MILIFSGTKDGRDIVQKVLNMGQEVLVSTATAYGSELITNHQQLKKIYGSLNRQQIIKLLKTENITGIIDATHPYAMEITANIKEAAEITNAKYWRYERPELDSSYPVKYSSLTEIANYLRAKSGKILLTIGSSRLMEITSIVPTDRIVARVLPLCSSLTRAEAAGLKPKQIIAMQGPFSAELNSMLLQEYQIKYLVSKDSGKEGGICEKIAAARQNGVEVLVLARPEIDYGNTYSSIAELVSVFKDSVNIKK